MIEGYRNMHKQSVLDAVRLPHTGPRHKDEKRYILAQRGTTRSTGSYRVGTGMTKK